MAKGIEDTTFYRWHRLIALDEVGGDPRSLDAPDAELLHAWAREQAERFPLGLTTLSTHDTKRSEDVRARLLAVAEDIDGWDACWEARAPAGGRVPRRRADGLPALPDAARRLAARARPARRATWRRRPTSRSSSRAGATRTSATRSRVSDFAARCLDGDIAQTFARVLAANEATIRATTLGSKLLQLTLPGVPDVYQGNEIAGARARRSRQPPAGRLRRAQQTCWTGSTRRAGRTISTSEKLLGDEPRARAPPRATRAVRARRRLRAAALDLAARARLRARAAAWRPSSRAGRDCSRRGGWKDHVVTLAPGLWNDVLTGALHAVEDGSVPCEDAAQPAAGRAPGEGLVTYRVWAPFARSGVDARARGRAHRDARRRGRLVGVGSSAAVPGAALRVRRSTAASRAPIRARSRCPTGPRGARSSSTATRCAATRRRVARRRAARAASSTSCTSARSRPRARSTPRSSGSTTSSTLGVDIVEVMPLASFPGRHGWGYDGVGLYAVHEPYGGPFAFRRFVDACHERGLGVCLDVVYNHLGPSGNHLARVRPVLHRPLRHAVGRGRQPRRRRQRRGAALRDRQRRSCGCATSTSTALRLDAVHALFDDRAITLVKQLTAEVDALSLRARAAAVR